MNPLSPLSPMFRDDRGKVPPGVLVLIAIGALLFLGFGMRGCWVSMTGMDRDFLGIPMFPRWAFTPYGFLGLSGLIQVGLAIWVGYDAHRRGLNGFLWGLLVLFTFIIGLIVYLIVGPAMAGRDGGPLFASAASPATPQPPPAEAAPPASTGALPRCPACKDEVRPEFKVCPYCGAALCCRQCQQPVQAGWKVCPHCTAPIETPDGPSDG